MMRPEFNILLLTRLHVAFPPPIIRSSACGVLRSVAFDMILVVVVVAFRDVDDNDDDDDDWQARTFGRVLTEDKRVAKKKMKSKK